MLDTLLGQAIQTAAEADAELVRGWDPVLAALYATINDPDANTRQVAGVALAEVLDRRGQQQDWTALVAVLRRIQTGERDRDLLITGLDRIDTAITGRALDGLTGADIIISPGAH